MKAIERPRPETCRLALLDLIIVMGPPVGYRRVDNLTFPLFALAVAVTAASQLVVRSSRGNHS